MLPLLSIMAGEFTDVSRRGKDRLYQEGAKTCGHEGRCPDQIEVQPGFAKEREAEFSIDYTRDQSCDREISCRMGSGGEHSCEGAGGRRDVIVGGHSGLCFDGVAAEEDRHDHQAGAVSSSHQKRPEGQVSEAYSHADPSPVLMPQEAIDSEADEDCGDEGANDDEWQRHAEKRVSKDCDGDGEGVAECDGDERFYYCAPLLLLHPKRDGEEPSHSGVESV